jgi:dihydrodipicolinate synthase/N-acetylneuraminate lyase
LSPEQTSAGKIDVRFKVVTQNLDELVELVRKLYALGFKQVSVVSETKIEGQMLSEISAVYERTD